MLRQKPGCTTGGCGGGSGSRQTARHPASTSPACSTSSGTAPKRSAVEAQAMPRSWPMNCKRRGERHRARQPDALGDDRQQGIAGGNGEGADGAGGDAVGDQQRIAEAARRQYRRQRQRRRGIEHVVAQQKAARVAAVGHQAAQGQEEQRRRHQRRLGHAHGEGIHMQHDRDQPREQHHLDAERHEPGAEAQQIGRETVGKRLRAGLDRRIGGTISCKDLVPLAHLIVKDTQALPSPTPSEARRWRSGRRCRHSTAPLW